MLFEASVWQTLSLCEIGGKLSFQYFRWGEALWWSAVDGWWCWIMNGPSCRLAMWELHFTATAPPLTSSVWRTPAGGWFHITSPLWWLADVSTAEQLTVQMDCRDHGRLLLFNQICYWVCETQRTKFLFMCNLCILHLFYDWSENTVFV